MKAEKLKYVIDLDGTIYIQNQLIPHADQFINYLIKAGRDFLLFTNSPEKSPLELSQKLGNMNVPVGPDRIVTSGCIAREYLRELSPGRALRVFVIGTGQLKDSFRKSGFEVIESETPAADFVVIGFDRGFCYEILRFACHHVFNGARLIATNADESIPTENGPIPHTGAIVAAVEYATAAKALVVGKPEAYTFRALHKKLGGFASELCIVGDRLDTDVKFAQRYGMRSFLVFTGMTKQEALIQPSALLFDRGFDSLLDVMNYDMVLNDEVI